MKNILYIVALATFFLACKKQGVEKIFDKLPEERMAERNQELRNKLVDNQNGWKAFLRTSARGGGYGFYMKFKADETVQMFSDWDGNTAATEKSSTYSIRYIMNTSLIFDTYNYITIMQDPQKAVNGGNQPDGLQSDIEFEYLRSAEDTVVLRGKKYRNFLYLIKATAAEASAYQNGNYATAIDNIKDYFFTHKNNYISLSQGAVKMEVIFDFVNKTLSVQGKLADGKIGSDKQAFGLSVDGAYFINAISFADKKFIALKMKDASTLVFIDDAGKEHPILQNPVPLTELVELFGSGAGKAFNSIYLLNGTKPAGVTSGFNSVYDGLITRFAATSRTIDTVEIRLLNSTSATVRIWYMSGTSRFLADAGFNYTLDAQGNLTFTDFKADLSNGNWTTRSTQIGNFADWIKSGPFKVDWVSSSVPGAPNYGGLYKKSDPADFYYGYLRKL